MSSQTTRRGFLAGGTAAMAAASEQRVMGANDRIRIAVVGTGGRGQYLMRELQKVGGAEFVAICDVYDVRRAQAAQVAGSPVEQYVDYRQLLARKDVDAVIVATPDHWHSTVAVDAMNAGKDVYIEKPMVHFPKDGQAIVKAARANRRIVQVGTQGRGMPQFVEAKRKYVESGIMGKVGLARTWYLSNSGYIFTAPAGMERKPDGLDWERWLGPGPKVPWNPEIYFSPYKWLHYDGGMIMGIGIHVVDSAHHLLGLHKPDAVVCGGGTWFFNDGRDTPDVVSFVVDYPQKVTVTFTAECLTANGVRTSAGVELRGTGGTLWAERYVNGEETAWQYTPNGKFSKEPAAQGPGTGTGSSVQAILQNWLESIRSRQKTVANEEEAYYSTMACFMANRAYQTRSRVTWQPEWDLPA